VARGRAGGRFRDRLGEVLFIDARKLGYMIDRTHREFGDEHIARIADTYHAWRGSGDGAYADVPGFCKSVSLEDIRLHDHILTPGRYVGIEPEEEDDEPFDDKMRRLVAQWHEQQAEAARLDAEIDKNFEMLGFGGHDEPHEIEETHSRD